VSFGTTQSQCLGNAAVTNCEITTSAEYTPKVSGVTPSKGWDGTAVTITGSGFVSGHTSIRLGEETCDGAVVSDNGNTVTCSASGEPPAGQHLVSVMVDSVGASVGNYSFTYTMHVNLLQPAEISTAGGAIITFSGMGIPSNASNRVDVLVGGVSCLIHENETDCDDTSCRCFMEPRASSNGDELGVEFLYDGELADCSVPSGCAVTASDAATPQISALSATSIVAGDTLEIEGTGLPDTSLPEVTIGGAACPVMEATDATVSCSVAGGEGGCDPDRLPATARRAPGADHLPSARCTRRGAESTPYAPMQASCVVGALPCRFRLWR
jgi:hypothetical protein